MPSADDDLHVLLPHACGEPLVHLAAVGVGESCAAAQVHDGHGAAAHAPHADMLHLREERLRLGVDLRAQGVVERIGAQLPLEVGHLVRQLAVGGVGGEGDAVHLRGEALQAPAVGALDDHQAVVLHLVLGHTALRFGDFLVADVAAHGHHAQRVVLGAVVDDLRAALRQLVVDKVLHVARQDVFLHYVDRHDGGGNHGHDDDDGDEPFAAAFHPGREVGVAVEAQHLDADEGGEGYEDGVDEEEVEGSEEVVPLRRGEAVARGAERRHEGRGNGHAGDHLSLALGRQRQHAGGAAAEGYEHVGGSRA